MSWMRMTYKSYLQYGRKCLEMTMTTLYALIGIHLFLLYYPPSHYASYSRLIYEWWYHMSTFAYASMLIIGGLMHLHNCHAKSDLWNSTFSSWLTNIMLGVIKVLCLWKDDIQWPLKLKIRWAGLFVTKELSVAMSIGCFYSWECIILQSNSDKWKAHQSMFVCTCELVCQWWHNNRWNGDMKGKDGDENYIEWMY